MRHGTASLFLAAAAQAGHSAAQAFAFPAFTGQFPVATVDIEVPVTPRNISNSTLANSTTPAFLLETVLFTTYYPTTQGAKSSASQHTWIPPPLDLEAVGFSDYVKYYDNQTIDPQLIQVGLGSLAQNITVPAVVDTALSTLNNSRTPVILFSHGDGATAYWYSELLGQLASYGYFVASIQHRDGSTFGTQMLSQNGSVLRNVTYITPDMVSPSVNFTQLKNIQRQFRLAEAVEVIKVLQNITDGGGDSIYKSNPRKEGQDLKNWGNKLDLNRLIVSGHSFGGNTALDILANSSNSVYGAMLFDPGRDSGLLPSTQPVPILIANSQEYSGNSTPYYGNDYFGTVKNYAQAALNNSLAGWFMTLVGAAHISITDAPLLPSTLASFFPSSTFNATIAALTAINQYQRASTEFLTYIKNGTRSDLLAAPAAYPTWNQPDQTALNATQQNVSMYWQVHAAPAQNTSVQLPGGAENTSSVGNSSSSSGSGSGTVGNNNSSNPKHNAAVRGVSGGSWTSHFSTAVIVAVGMYCL